MDPEITAAIERYRQTVREEHSEKQKGLTAPPVRGHSPPLLSNENKGNNGIRSGEPLSEANATHAFSITAEVAQDEEDPNNPRQRKRIEGKFVVCDHCRSHGLPCDEWSVGDQCILHGTACVRRWCDLSPLSKESCPRSLCRHLHRDYMPNAYGLQWVVLNGKLRGYPDAERKGRKHGPKETTVGAINAIQQEAWDAMAAHVDKGEATWETVMMTCPCVERERAEARRQEKAVAEVMQSQPQFLGEGW